MRILRDYIIEDTLCEKSTTIIQRARHLTAQNTVILKSIKTADAPAADIAALEHDYWAIRKVSSDFVIKAESLQNATDGRLVMILEDIGGIDLKSFLNATGRIPLERFLDLALAAACGIRDIHSANLIHKDINPANIIFNLHTNSLKIIDFHIATELSHESQEINIKGVLEGSLRYISPEQTGRINRFLDYRTDFYSLGATLYELITGVPMFTANDTLGYVSAHISRTPPRVDALDKAIPKVIADIIATLTAKAPEHRYQSSLGLISDLQITKDKLLHSAVIAPFPLKSRDISERFEIPGRLYGRKEQQERLFAVFDEVAAGKAKLLLVRGQSGIGKSALIHEVLRKIVSKNGIFIKGKYDQFARNQPYFAISQAFKSAIDQVMRFPDAQYQTFISRLRDALHPNGAVITNLMPEMVQLLGDQPPMQQLNPMEAQVVVLRTLCDFINVFASSQHPLVLFLDDMQWVDSATLELFEKIFAKNQFCNLMVILSYRDNEVPNHHPLSLSLDEIKKCQPLETIDLTAFTLENTNEMTADTLRWDTKDAWELSALVQQNTLGNPFYVEEFLKELYQGKLVRFDHLAGKWQADILAVAKISASTNIVEFLMKKLTLLSPATIEALKLAACLGHNFQLSLLALILKKDPVATLHTLEEAIREGVLIPLDRSYRLLNSMKQWDPLKSREFDSAFKFQHDRVQQAVYSLIDDNLRKHTHLVIARTLYENQGKWQIDLIEVSRHYLECYSLVTEETEKKQLIELCLTVAQKAIDANAYKQAGDYSQVAIHLVEEADFSADPQLSNQVYHQAAKIAFQLGDIERGKAFIQILLERNPQSIAKAEILTTKTLHLSTLGYLREAVETAIEVLRLLGYSFPLRVNALHVAIETLKILVTVGFGDTSRFLRLEKIKDPRHDIALRNLALIGQTSYNLGDVNGYALALFRGAIVTMKHGLSDLSAYMFATSAAVLIGVFKLVKISRRLSATAIKLNETTEDLFWRSSCATMLCAFNYLWHFDHRILPKLFAETLQLTYQTGNNYYRGATAALYPKYVEDPDLSNAYELSKKMIAIASEANAIRFLEAIQFIHGGFANMLGLTRTPYNLDYEGFNESKMRAQLIASENRMALGGYMATKVEVLVLRERWREACKYTWYGRKLLLGIIATKYEMNYRFYGLLAFCWHIPRLKGAKRYRYYLYALIDKMIIKLLARNNPESFGAMGALVDASFAALDGRSLEKTLKKYENAIDVAKCHSVKMHALACHQAAVFAQNRGLDGLAKSYLKNAVVLYKNWGGEPFARWLQEKYGLEETKSHGATQSTVQGTMLMQNAQASLDIHTIFKVSKAIAKEVKLEKMTETFLEMLIENTGASRGVLLLSDENKTPYVQAEIDAASGSFLLMRRELAEASLPSELISYIFRSQKPLLIDDCHSIHQFAGDSYFEKCAAKAILASPILQYGQVIGVIYLENSETTHAFTPERNLMVELLAAQVAIAIENSALYQSLENRVRFRTAEIRQMLANLEQGIMSVYGSELRIHSEYSAHLQKILEKSDLAGKTLDEVLLSQLGMNLGELERLRKSLKMMLNQNVISFDLTRHHLPGEIHFRSGSQMKILEVDWTPISNDDDLVERILICLRDVTSQRILQEEIAQKQRELQMISQILDIPRDEFLDYMQNSRKICRLCQEAGKSAGEADVRKSFIQIHTLKGLASALNLTLLVDKIHKTEGFYTRVLRGEQTWSWPTARADLDELLNTLDEYEKVAQEKLSGSDAALIGRFEEVERIVAEYFRCNPAGNQHAIVAELGERIFSNMQKSLWAPLREIKRLAESMQKNSPQLVFMNDVYLYPKETRRLLAGVFIHLLRNSMDHGFELPAERIECGKSPWPSITITSQLVDQNLVVHYADDGRGVNLGALLQRAIEKNIVSGATQLPPLQIASLIFHEGFTVKDMISKVSGRGLGMSAARELLRGAKGDIAISLGDEDQRGYRALSFVITLPRSMVIVLHEDVEPVRAA